MKGCERCQEPKIIAKQTRKENQRMAGSCAMALVERSNATTSPVPKRKTESFENSPATHLFRFHYFGYAAVTHEPYGGEVPYCYSYTAGGKNTLIEREMGGEKEDRRGDYKSNETQRTQYRRAGADTPGNTTEPPTNGTFNKR